MIYRLKIKNFWDLWIVDKNFQISHYQEKLVGGLARGCMIFASTVVGLKKEWYEINARNDTENFGNSFTYQVIFITRQETKSLMNTKSISLL